MLRFVDVWLSLEHNRPLRLRQKSAENLFLHHIDQITIYDGDFAFRQLQTE